MRRGAGLWIDHRKAVVVFVPGEMRVVLDLRSQIESQLRRHSRAPMSKYGPQEEQPDDMRQTAFTGQLDLYFDKVVSCLRDEPAIFIFGPGEAKGELKKRLERDKLGARIIGVETAGRMTDNQIAAKVRARLQSGVGLTARG